MRINNIAASTPVLNLLGEVAGLLLRPGHGTLCGMMSPKDFRAFVRKHRVDNGKAFNLTDHDPGDTGKLKSADKNKAEDLLKSGIQTLAVEQDKLYAQDCWALLVILQGLDAAGKDSVIRHCMSGVNPQACEVTSFKEPSKEELDHDWMWRCVKRLPERGRIGIFNRSYYEEVLVVRVHKEILGAQKLPPALVTRNIWSQRFEDIRNHERYLSRNGIVIRKFFLNVSKPVQKKRFLKRLDEPGKNWKFAPADVHERQYWNRYQQAYEEMIRNTAKAHAPWFVVPADHKWYTRLVVAAAIADALLDLELEYPKVPQAKRALLREARAQLAAEKS